ncbi:MAG: Z1 domain-containing protein [Betaproteobacteria bacterium]|nr:Z1 domain-containing protein [Betaproteobacteria bacterium]
MTDTMTVETALRIVRVLMANGVPRETALGNPAIPTGLREAVSGALSREETIVLRPATIITAQAGRGKWLRRLDRSIWYYWPMLRDYLLNTKNWPVAAVRSLDESTDRILAEMSSPEAGSFDIRGLVLGFVQSGKTANFTALIAKSADVGYRLIIVLSGLDNGLRRQTQIRVDKELAGYTDNRPGAVPLPPMGRQWHQFTTEDLLGDFRPGSANYGALQGTQPVLVVVKKNGPVLRRLHAWLDAAPDEVRRTLPLLVIDDEADLASVDTRGSYQKDDEPPDEDYEAPAVINGLIRQLLKKFQRCAFVAYTATPFANILIPHDTIDPAAGNDLYPKDFIIDLPKPIGYFGAEELFGRQDPASGEMVGGIDAIRHISDEDLRVLSEGGVPETLSTAIIDFVLAGAARAERGCGAAPATMLIHTSLRIADQYTLWAQIKTRFGELRDEWRYQRTQGVRDRTRDRWESEFEPVTRASFVDREREFEQIEEFIGPFLEAVVVRQINSASGDVLDYEHEPGLKAIAVGGNKLARGLTLEGLLISYFVRPSAMYDTLMQMGRWFGFRGGYEDLTRIWTTAELAGWFSDLATVEHELRQDIRRYEVDQVTPLQLGARILQHPAMLVTSPLKSRFGTSIVVDQSYNGQVVQTVKFPFRRPDDLAVQLEENMLATGDFLTRLGVPTGRPDPGPIWTGVPTDALLSFLAVYKVDQQVRSISIPLLQKYIERQVERGRLARWTVAVKGRASRDPTLGPASWRIGGEEIHMISRSRLKGDPDSLGVITSPGDEAAGFDDEQVWRTQQYAAEEKVGLNPAARHMRDPAEGLLLIYPISRYSGGGLSDGGARRPLYDNPNDPLAKDVVGIAISFPRSQEDQGVSGKYVVGTVGWSPE